MKLQAGSSIRALLALLTVMAARSLASAASPSAQQALKLQPMQAGVDCDRVKPEDAAKCKISAHKIDGKIGWVVESPEGILLRKFVDTNGDNIVDQWSYYKDGVEVYRDIDSKFTGKADQFRWFHTGGTRWGADTEGNGKVTVWKAISAEEASAEIVAALAGHDADRFGRVLLTSDELEKLGLGKAKSDAVAAKIAKADSDFRSIADRQRVVTADSKWLQFSGGKPGIVPAGTEGSTNDIEVYENVVAIVQTGDKNSQVQIGTLVRVGNAWKAIDSPTMATDDQPEVAGGFFFQSSPAARGQGADSVAGSDETQKAIAEMEKLEPADPHRIELIQKIVDQTKTPEDRAMWYRQLADTMGAAVQMGKLPDGEKQLEALLEKVQKDNDKNLTAYVKIRLLTANYNRAVSAPKADIAKLQADWVKTLEQYVSDFPASPDAAEAMLQLGIAREYAGQDDDAKKWYDRISRDFADSPQARKAAGAVTRLDLVGKPLVLSGKSPSGQTVDVASFHGKVVLVMYWATWAKPEMAALKQLAAKYDKSFAVLGVNVDSNARDLKGYLDENPLPWPQIFEEGGQDSRPANMLGIITVPTMILVDQDGKVVDRNLQMGDLEAEVKKLLP